MFTINLNIPYLRVCWSAQTLRARQWREVEDLRARQRREVEDLRARQRREVEESYPTICLVNTPQFKLRNFRTLGTNLQSAAEKIKFPWCVEQGLKTCVVVSNFILNKGFYRYKNASFDRLLQETRKRIRTCIEGATHARPPLPILSPLRPVLRCGIGGTNSYDCPLPALSDKCSANLKCVPNKYCRKLKRLKQAKKHVQKREGKQEKWEKKCSNPSAPI